GLARLGDHAAASAEAAASAALVETSALSQYNLSGALSLGRAAAYADLTLDPAKRKRLADSYGSRAIAFLKGALAAGYFDDPADASQFRADSDLKAIRELDSFKSLEAQVSAANNEVKE